MDGTKSGFEDEPLENIVAKLRDAFKDEAYELLSELETALLELEQNPGDRELVSRVFRALHTIKGSGASCEFHDISKFAHEVESVFDLVRKDRLSASNEVIDLTLAAVDQIKTMFDAYYRGGAAGGEGTGEIITEFKKLLPDDGGKESAVFSTPPVSAQSGTRSTKSPAKQIPGKNITYRIRFRPTPDIFTQGTDPVMLMNELRQLGHCTVVAQTENIPYLEDFDPQACHTYWDAILTTDRGANAIQDVFIFVKDHAEVKIDVIDEEGRLDDEMSYKRLDEILLDRGDLTPDDLQKVLKSKKLLGEMLVEAGVISGDKVWSALIEQQHVREIREKRQGVDSFSSIRVATRKLDDLVDLVGELVTVQARLSQTALSTQAPGLLTIAEEVERLTGELRDNTMSIRMLPIGTTFSKFNRLFRDLSRDLGKELEFETDGGETELDKTVIERLSEPLVHLIRNSIDHGIEPPDVRKAAGKPLRGTVRLSALHSGAHVLVRISDDGAGMDREAIRAKAVEKGLIQPDAELSDKDLFALIFTPGFSTAKKITSVSGRGVGLDVVKKTIDALRGSIEISSQKGAGAVITLKLPLTLAIIDGLLVKIQEQYFVLPLSSVKECVELAGSGAKNTNGRHIANVRGEIVPYINLREQFGIEGGRPGIEQIVITEMNENKIGFVVDAVIGGYQTVIKNLGRMYRDVEGVSGATILGDGTVALILDAPKLVRNAEKEEHQVMKG